MTKVWIDDIRVAPSDWVWVKTSEEALLLMQLLQSRGETVDEVAFDHDLGGDDTSRRVLIWMIEEEFFSQKILLLTANPVGREWLLGMVRRYFPDETEVQ